MYDETRLCGKIQVQVVQKTYYILYKTNFELVEKSLYFTLKGTLINTEEFEYTIPLKLKRIY